jgi:hypothetical protein
MNFTDTRLPTLDSTPAAIAASTTSAKDTAALASLTSGPGFRRATQASTPDGERRGTDSVRAG